MFEVDIYRLARFAVYRDGVSQREAAPRFGIDHRTDAMMQEQWAQRRASKAEA